MRTHRYRFGYVLVLILAALAFGLAAPEGEAARIISVVLRAATLVAAVFASQAPRWMVRAAGALALLLIAGTAGLAIGSNEVGHDSARVVSLVLVLLAGMAITGGVVREFREERSVTVHTMFGVLCLYLLLGTFYATGLQAIQAISDTQMLAPHSDASSNFLYFSFVTITTTGFGDVVAATNLGRSIAVTEALTGQIYLVTVVALIVSNLQPRRARA